MKTFTLSYRPEIDGLRAVAVLLVILGHLGFSAISGGFIGVDIFFVISGYLITSIVAGEIQDGSFSFRQFYKRRIIRLAPAYFLVLAVTTLVGAVVLLPQDFLAFFKSVVFSTFFSANYYLWRVLGDYFGATPSLIPLLHLWSLAVEEQFYIFWPPTLLILSRLTKPKYFMVPVVIAASASLWISEWGASGPHFGAAYYFMPTRAFELLIGAMIALAPGIQLRSRIARQSFTLLGALLIAVPAFTYSDATVFPGLNALWPCLGTSLIIAFTDKSVDGVGRFLASAPMNFIGRISYPAYLWHWPIIAYLNIIGVRLDSYVAVAVICVTLLLSTLTYWYIEKPAKRVVKAFPFIKVAGYGFALPAVFFVSLSVFAQVGNGWPQRFDERLIAMSDAIHSSTGINRHGCLSGTGAGSDSRPLPPEDCVLGINKPGVDILLVGDSHAEAFSNAIDVMAKDAGLRGYELAQKGTVYLPGVRAFSYYDDGGKGIGRDMHNFYERNEFVQHEIQQGKYKFVVLAGAYPLFLKNTDYYLNGDVHVHDHEKSNHVFLAQFEQAIEEIIKSGAVPVIVNDDPYYPDGIENCTLDNLRFGHAKKCYMDTIEFKRQFSEWNTILKQLIGKYPVIKVIDPDRVICDESRCYTELQGVPLYNDSNHLNGAGAALIGWVYLKRFGNPFRAE